MVKQPNYFKTIVVDPPWTPEMSLINGGAPKGSPQRFYETMDISRIKSLDVPSASKSHLYLWCLSQHVNWAYDVATAWGFNPIILMTWKKPGLGVGRFRCNTEHFLVARKGNRQGQPFGTGGRFAQATAGTLFEWPRRNHSTKPEEFFKLVERLSQGPYLELFSRKKRTGWTCLGDAISGNPIEKDLYDLKHQKYAGAS